MAETFWPNVVDALLTRWNANATLAAEKVAIFDGPPTTEHRAPYELFVGASGSDFGDNEDAGGSEQAWAGIGRFERDETVLVMCGLWVSQGSSNMGGRRAKARDLFGVIVADIRTGTSDLGLPGVPGVFEASIVNVRWRQIQPTTGGAQVGVIFTVRAHCRI